MLFVLMYSSLGCTKHNGMLIYGTHCFLAFWFIAEYNRAKGYYKYIYRSKTDGVDKLAEMSKATPPQKNAASWFWITKLNSIATGCYLLKMFWEHINAYRLYGKVIFLCTQYLKLDGNLLNIKLQTPPPRDINNAQHYSD